MYRLNKTRGMSLSSLSVELLLLIQPNLQYASDLNALAQTCRPYHTNIDQLHDYLYGRRQT
jgi:hypothetical protein